jgi:cell division inhibitor SepF
MAGVWRKTLIYLGLVEDDELDSYSYDDEYEDAPAAVPERQPLRRVKDDRPARRDAVVTAIPTPSSAKLHVVQPSAFNDAQEIGDKFREGISVIMNLVGADPKLARRLVDFASGLAYGLRGSMQAVTDSVYLLTPAGVQVSAEERRRFLEESGFYNQA